MTDPPKNKPKLNRAFKLDNNGDRLCLRCHEPFGLGDKCANCEVHKDRRVISHYRRSRPVGGKRGRNSGKTRSNKKG